MGPGSGGPSGIQAVLQCGRSTLAFDDKLENIVKANF